MSNYFCLGKARENLLGNQVIKSKSEFLKRGREEGRTETKTLNCFMQLLFFLSHCHDCFHSRALNGTAFPRFPAGNSNRKHREEGWQLSFSSGTGKVGDGDALRRRRSRDKLAVERVLVWVHGSNGETAFTALNSPRRKWPHARHLSFSSPEERGNLENYSQSQRWEIGGLPLSVL